jgi:hypothetical protein
MRAKWTYMLGGVLICAQTAVMAAQSSVSISLPTKVEAAQIDPIVVPAHQVIHGKPIEVEEPFCVYSNDTESGDYQVTLSGSGQDNAFELSDGKRSFAYQVAYNDENLPTGFVAAKATKVLSDQLAGAIQSYPCHVDNARIRLRIEADDYDQLPAGTYTGALFVTVGED